MNFIPRSPRAQTLTVLWSKGWLDDIGLPQYKDQFNEGRVDGQMLQYLTVVSKPITDMDIRKYSYFSHINNKTWMKHLGVGCVSVAAAVLNPLSHFLFFSSWSCFPPRMTCCTLKWPASCTTSASSVPFMSCTSTSSTPTVSSAGPAMR